MPWGSHNPDSDEDLDAQPHSPTTALGPATHLGHHGAADPGVQPGVGQGSSEQVVAHYGGITSNDGDGLISTPPSPNAAQGGDEGARLPV